MTPSADHPRCTILIHFSNSQVSIEQALSPCFFAAPGTPSSFFPSGYEGMARQGALPSSVQDPHLLAEMRKRLPARHPNMFNARAHLRPSSSASPTVVNGTAAPGRAFRAPSRSGFPDPRLPRAPTGFAVISDGLSGKKLRASLNGCTVSQLLAGGSYWPPGGAPAPPECVGGAFVSRPRAPHPAPSSDAS